MKKLGMWIVSALILLGCQGNTDKVDTTFLCEEKEPIVIYQQETECKEAPKCEPVPCQETIYGQLTNGWLERIDTTNIKLNHYINEEEIEENLADIVDQDGVLVSSNPITIPEYTRQPMKHVLIVEFTQIK